MSSARVRVFLWLGRHIIIVSYLLSVTATVGSIVVGKSAFTQQRDSEQWVLHTMQAIGGAEAIRSVVLDAESTARAYLITGEQSFLGAYRSLSAQVDDEVRTFSNLTADNPRQQRNVRALEQLLAHRFALLDAQIALQGGNQDRQLIEAGIDSGAFVMNDIKRTLTAMTDEERRLLVERTEIRDASISHVDVDMLGMALGAIAVLTLVFGYSYYLWNEQRRAEAEAVHLAHHDALTGLPNRRLLQDRMTTGRAHALRNQGIFAVLCLDLDGFKHVNDTLGHDAGDELLIAVARRLRQIVRGEDTVARVGGDEFKVALLYDPTLAACATVAEKIVSALREPFDLNAGVARISVSIGIAIFPKDGADDEAMFQAADAALYRAKASGKNQYRYAGDGRADEAVIHSGYPGVAERQSG